jgi:hypothetical protein
MQPGRVSAVRYTARCFGVVAPCRALRFSRVSIVATSGTTTGVTTMLTGAVGIMRDETMMDPFIPGLLRFEWHRCILESPCSDSF